MDVALISDDWQSRYGNSQTVLDSILEYLALVKMSPGVSRPAAKWDDGGVLLSLR
jgi:hypothetical protein